MSEGQSGERRRRRWTRDEGSGDCDVRAEGGDVLGVFVGHEHDNSFGGRYQNSDLGFTQSCGFNAYGSRTKRGVRCIVLDENEQHRYQPYTRTYDALVGTKLARPVFDYLRSKGPATLAADSDLTFTGIGAVASLPYLILLPMHFR